MVEWHGKPGPLQPVARPFTRRNGSRHSVTLQVASVGVGSWEEVGRRRRRRGDERADWAEKARRVL